MQFLAKSSEILAAIKKIRPSRIAVGYVGKRPEKFIALKKLESFVVSPTGTSDPDSIERIADAIGWDNVHLLPRLHAKMYIGRDAAVVASANLSERGLGKDPRWETGIHVNDLENLEAVFLTFEEIVKEAMESCSDLEAKKRALRNLRENQKKTDKVWPKPVDPEDPPDAPPTLDDILDTVGPIPEYEPSVFFGKLAATELGTKTWKYLFAPSSLGMLAHAVSSGRPAVRGIDIEYPVLFANLLPESQSRRNHIKKMIGHMVRQVLEFQGYVFLRSRKYAGGSFFSYGSIYARPE